MPSIPMEQRNGSLPEMLKKDFDILEAENGKECLDILLIIPGLFEPPVRTLRATIPENESHIFR